MTTPVPADDLFGLDVNALFRLFGPVSQRIGVSLYATQANLNEIIGEREDYRRHGANADDDTANVHPIVTELEEQPSLASLVEVDAAALLALFGPTARPINARLVMSESDFNTIITERQSVQSQAISTAQASVTQA